MADQKITQLTEKTTIATTDLFPIVDMSGTPETKHITKANLFNAIVATGGMTLTGNLSFQTSGRIFAQSGTVGAPVYSFAVESNLGWLRGGAGILAATVGSTVRLNISASGLAVGKGTTVATAMLDVNGAIKGGGGDDIFDFTRRNSAANSIISMARLFYETTGTPSAGIGAAFSMRAQSLQGTGRNIGYFGARFTDVTAGAEIGEMIISPDWHSSVTISDNRILKVRAVASDEILVSMTKGNFVLEDGSIGVGATPNASAQLDVSSTTKGFLPPRMTTTQKNAISSPATGLVIHDTSLTEPAYYDGSWKNYGLSVSKLDKGLIQHMPLDFATFQHISNAGGVLDIGPVRNAGQNFGATFNPTGGPDGTGEFVFDGTDDYISVPHNVNQLLVNGFTLSAWINLDVIDQAQKILDKSTGITGNDGFDFGVSSASGRLFMRVNNGTPRFTATSAIAIDTWYHVVVTVASDATVTFYLNGVLSGTPGATGALSGITTTNALTIGNRSGATDTPFDGGIAKVRMYSRVLSTAEITALYNGQL